jgi:hypothetical protein
MINQVGAFTVQKMATAAPNWSNNFDQFPNQKQKWVHSFDVKEEPEPNGRSAGSIDRAGLINCSYGVEPRKQVTGAILTRSAPFMTRRSSHSLAHSSGRSMPTSVRSKSTHSSCKSNSLSYPLRESQERDQYVYRHRNYR